WWSRAIKLGTWIAVLLMILSVAGTRLGLWSFELGFLFLAGGIMLAFIGFVGGLAGCVVSVRKGYTQEVKAMVVCSMVGLLVIAGMFLQYQKATSVPAIHNISTDQINAPVFDKVLALRIGDNPVEYDVDVLGELQSSAYPGVIPLETSLDTVASMERTEEVLANMGLEIINSDYDEMRVEATATSLLFGFKDDLVVRIRATSEGSVIDLHSVSRVGQSDLGVNAKRILQFMAEF
ncbi:MAG: DUF1499 domain-containing protein, partial [Pseudomonadales bacterium]|nr:DUF1499 domain-containing protein [Pseudomonadales bacterium]